MQDMYPDFACGSLKDMMCKERLRKLDAFTLKKPLKNRILLRCLAVEMVGPDPSLRSRVKGREAKETSYVKENS